MNIQDLQTRRMVKLMQFEGGVQYSFGHRTNQYHMNT
jgi:hypothetical protein